MNALRVALRAALRAALRGRVRQGVFWLREYLLPFGCPLCGSELIGAETWYGLCGGCYASIERELQDTQLESKCDCCGKPLISELERCLSCRNGMERSFDRVTVLFPYTGKYRNLLTAYKFGKNSAIGNYFAEKILEILASMPSAHGECPIVPVPPRPGKIRKNGWDQIEYLAQLLDRNGLAVQRCLKRLPSKSQKELGRENRFQNLKGRIVPVRQPPKTAILIDDVMTTGATLDACAAALKEAGTRTVHGLCLFYD